MPQEQGQEKKRLPLGAFVLRLGGLFVALLLLCMLFFMVGNVAAIVWDQSVANAEKLNAQKAMAASAVIGETQADMEHFVAFSDYVAQTSPDPFLFFDQLKDYAQEHEFQRVVMLMADGKHYNNDGTFSEALPEAVEAVIAGGKPMISDPYFDQNLNAQAVAVYQPSGEENRLVSGCVGVYLLSRIYARFPLEGRDGTQTLVVNANGEVIVDNADSARSGDSLFSQLSRLEKDDGALEELKSALAQGTAGTYRFGGEKKQAMVICKPVGGACAWSVATVVQSNGATALSRKIGRNLTAVLVLSLLSGFVLAYLLLWVQRKRRVTRGAEQFDQVVHCPNQTGFEAQAEILLAENPSALYGLMYLNIDNYQMISTMYGVQTTDSMLQFLSHVIERSLNPGETYGRLTNGRFAILAGYRFKNELAQRFEKIAASMGGFSMTQSQRYYIKMTAGFYCVNREEKHTVARMIERAMLAQRSVEESGEADYAYYDVSTRQQMLKEAQIEATMEHALKAGEFELFLQPKYDISQNRIDSAEALVRWNSSAMGSLLPGEFIPQFEKNGFIVELDKYIFEKVCQLVGGMVERGERTVPISINVSRASAQQKDFISHYVKVKKKHRIADGFLELEFTESIALESYDILASKVVQLQEEGFACSMDDFGEGFSSFKILKAIPFDVIKLDKFFLTASENHRRDELLLEGVIAMAKSLGMTVIAEGVEEEEELDLLERLHCDLIQGFWYAKPMSVEAYRKFVTLPPPIRNKK